MLKHQTRATRRSRRWFLGAGATMTGALIACRRTPSAPRVLGRPLSPYGSRSRFEQSNRFFANAPILEAGTSSTPLQDTYGIITPSALHFERHHSGVPDIDPAQHRLTIYGL